MGESWVESVERRRSALGMSKRELSRRAKMPTVQLWRYLTGRASPNLRQAERLNDVLSAAEVAALQ